MSNKDTKRAMSSSLWNNRERTTVLWGLFLHAEFSFYCLEALQGKPVTHWRRHDDASWDIPKGVHRASEALRKRTDQLVMRSLVKRRHSLILSSVLILSRHTFPFVQGMHSTKPSSEVPSSAMPTSSEPYYMMLSSAEPSSTKPSSAMPGLQKNN
jgi:hypothetical protein